MGGNVPLGYDAQNRRFVINRAEADTVRMIFELYKGLGCVSRLKAEADRLRLRTKVRKRARGASGGGCALSRGHFYRILANPIYIGRIAHKGDTYPGEHTAIIDQELWDAVQTRLSTNRKRRRLRSYAPQPSLLAGFLVDADGDRLTPNHTVKSRRDLPHVIGPV